MKKINIIVPTLAVILTFFIITRTALSAPAPWGLAVNNQEGLCMNYWSGDEFQYNPLPEGWKPFYYDNLFYVYNTSLGICNITYSVGDWYFNKSFSGCFESIGCDEVNFESFNSEKLSILEKDFGCRKFEPPYHKMFAIDIKTKECIILACTQGKYWDRKSRNGDIEVHFSGVPYYVFEINNKTCNSPEKMGRSNDFTDCCTQLGYKIIEYKNPKSKRLGPLSFGIVSVIILLVLVISIGFYIIRKILIKSKK